MAEWADLSPSAYKELRRKVDELMNRQAIMIVRERYFIEAVQRCMNTDGEKIQLLPTHCVKINSIYQIRTDYADG